MSKPTYSVLKNPNDPTTNASVGPVNGLSTSSSARMKMAYPDSPANKASVTLLGAEAPVNPTKENYRELYTDKVLGFNDFSDEFGEIVDLSYESAPDLTNLSSPEGEAPQGKDGSTIVAAGIGPNVNVMNLNKDEEVVMVDPTFINNLDMRMSSPPFVGNGSLSPSESSTKISKTTLGEYLLGVSKSSEGGS